MTKKLRELKQVIQDGILTSRAQCIITGKSQCCTLNNYTLGTSLVVQQLRIHTSNAGGVGLIPGWGTKAPRAMEQLSMHAITTEPTHHN